MLLRERVPGFLNRVYRTQHGIWTPEIVVPRHQNVLGVLCTMRGKILIPASNIVTDAGDIYYAESMAAEATTNVFATHELGTAGTPGKASNRSNFTAIGSTQKVNSGTYPQTNDADADNTGGGVDIVTHLAEYTKADFNDAAISHGWITNATPGASEPLLTGYAFASTFGKTANDTLKVFVNHEALGV